MFDRFTMRMTGVALGLTVVTAPAWALTGEDVLDWMGADERAAYLAGSVEMAAFLSSMGGNPERSRCIMDWYFHGEGPGEIVAALDRHKERQALPVVQAMIESVCGE